MIEPDPDWYGSYARRSAIADYLELLALSGRSMVLEDLADLIRDNRWTVALGERIGVPSPPDDEAEDGLGAELDMALERASDVVSVLNERVSATNGHYPFDVSDDGRLTYVDGDPIENPYVRLLAITVAHATRLTIAPPAHQVFEVMVVSALLNAGFRTTGVGIRARQGGGFHAVLMESCDAVGLMAYPEAASARTFAHDEGSDTLTNVWTNDLRPGGLQLVGQVTCARSNDWDAKMCEPSPSQWRSWLGDHRSPDVFLAVPHHVEDATRSWLLAKRDRDIFDRLRLSPLLANQVGGEDPIVRAILDQAVLT